MIKVNITAAHLFRKSSGFSGFPLVLSVVRSVECGSTGYEHFS